MLDVRTQREFTWFALTEAQNSPDLPANSGKMPPLSPSQEIMDIRMTGHRSSLVARNLGKKQYSRINQITLVMMGGQRWK